MMFSFERALIHPDELAFEGLVAPRFSGRLTAFFCLLFWGVAGAAFALGAASFTVASSAVFSLLGAVLARLCAVDMCHQLLPDIYTLPLLLAGVLLSFFPHFVPFFHAEAWGQSLLGAVIGGGVFYLPHFIMSRVRQEEAGIGGGDVKLAAAAGAWLGPWLFPFFLGLACLIGLGLTFLPKRGAVPFLPFGPALCAAFWIFLLWKRAFCALLLGS